MDFKDFFKKRFDAEKAQTNKAGEDIREENTEMSFSPMELSFVALCVKILGLSLSEKPDMLESTGLTGILLGNMVKEIDIEKLNKKFDSAMLDRMQKKYMK